MSDPNSFSWTLPPLAGRLLGAAGFSFAVIGCYVLESRQQQLVRAYIVMLAVYLAPLVAAILLFHLGRFNWSAPITYAFFVVAGGMAAAALWHLGRRTTLGKSFQDRPAEQVPIFMQGWLWLVAIITGLWGLAMFIYPRGPWPEVWIWPQDPLTSRLIATMLLTLCAGAAMGLRSVALARMSLWTFAT
jgi:glucan phosphoethanolaminetransferase (alkaline phosphatase superfamily)